MAGKAPPGRASLGGHPVTPVPRRGIVISGFPPSHLIDEDTLLFAFFKATKGMPEISSCHFTDDNQRAYVEFADTAGKNTCADTCTYPTL